MRLWSICVLVLIAILLVGCGGSLLTGNVVKEQPDAAQVIPNNDTPLGKFPFGGGHQPGAKKTPPIEPPTEVVIPER